MYDYYCFFFNDTATTEIYTLSLHDALPILRRAGRWRRPTPVVDAEFAVGPRNHDAIGDCASEGLRRCSAVRSEEHTSELQSRQYLVCRLLLEKKKSAQ